MDESQASETLLSDRRRAYFGLLVTASLQSQNMLDLKDVTCQRSLF